MWQLLLSSVSASAILSGTPAPADVHGVPSAAYWRLRFWGGESTYFSLSEIEFRSTVGGSTITTGGTIIASGERSGFEKENAFDGDASSTHWSVLKSYGAWIGYQFTGPVKVREVAITARPTYQSHTPTVFAVECSDDGANWTVIEVFHEEDTWTASETRTWIIGGGSYDTKNTRVGFNTSYDCEVMGGVFLADVDLTICRVRPYLNTNRILDATIALVDDTTYEITEILTTVETDVSGSDVEIPTPITPISAGQYFAILFSCNVASVNQNVPLRYVTSDHYPLVATPVAFWMQDTKDLTVSAVPNGDSDPGDPCIFFAGTWNNGLDTVTEGDFVIPEGVPKPAIWYSPEHVSVDGSGNILNITNRGTGGVTFDATPEGTNYAIQTPEDFWNGRNTFEIPDASGGYEFTALFNAHSIATITTYSTGELSTFDDYDAIVSGPVSNTNELELVGHGGESYFYSGKAPYIFFDGEKHDAGDLTPVLPMNKKSIGAVEDTSVWAGLIWRDNAATARNWHGTMGDILIFQEELEDAQMLALLSALDEHYAFDLGDLQEVQDMTAYAVTGVPSVAQSVPEMSAYLITHIGVTGDVQATSDLSVYVVTQ